MSKRLVSVFVLLAAVSFSAAAQRVTGILKLTGNGDLQMDSVGFQTLVGFVVQPTPGWGGDAAAQDTFEFPELLETWPTLAKLWLSFNAMPIDTITIRNGPTADSWYTLALGRPPVPEIKFLRLQVGVEEGQQSPARMRLSVVQNPTSGPVRLVASLPQGTLPDVEVYNGAGLLVRKFSGLVWDRRDLSGREVAAGLYLLRAMVGSKSALAKVVLTD